VAVSEGYTRSRLARPPAATGPTGATVGSGIEKLAALGLPHHFPPELPALRNTSGASPRLPGPCDGFIPRFRLDQLGLSEAVALLCCLSRV
jgi:hypothetical protein